jgi:hypothetical protein
VDAVDTARDTGELARDPLVELGDLLRIHGAPVAGDPQGELAALRAGRAQPAAVGDELLRERAHLDQRGVRLGD